MTRQVVDILAGSIVVAVAVAGVALGIRAMRRPRSGLNRILAAAAAILTALAAGCGGDSGRAVTSQPAGDTQPPAPVTSPAPTETTTPAVTPDELGELIGEHYVEAIGELVASLGDRPRGPAVAAELSQLKERYIRELVELGRLREAMEPADRAVVDARIAMRVNGISPDLFAAYQAIQAEYSSIEPEIAELVTSFNIITQYANFDLLTQQDPDEAARVLTE